MPTLDKSIIAHYNHGGEKFEIIVDSKLALDYKLGKKKDLNNILVVDEIFKDAKKGERHSSEKLKKAFGTEDIYEITKKIITEGEVPITTEQRREMIEEKRRKIISILARECIDPRTGAPQTPQRIENALSEVRLNIDPFKPAEMQIEEVIRVLRPILPMKFEKARFSVKIPADSAQRIYGFIKEYNIKKEEWLNDGSLAVVLEMPAGLQGEFFDKINKLTSGRAVIKDLKSK